MSSVSELISHSKFAAAGRRGGGDVSMELGKKVNHFTFFLPNCYFFFKFLHLKNHRFMSLFPKKVCLIKP
jgi:hypothetical protein